MSLIVNPSALSDWSLTRERICDKALQKCGRFGTFDSAPAAEDRNICLEALDSILKNLMWYGYSWPNTLISSATITFSTGVQSQALPQDFYGGEKINYLDVSGINESPLLVKLTADQWRNIVNKATISLYPDRYYIDNFNTLWIYPITTQNITGKLYYQKVIPDSVENTALSLDSPWILGLVYAVAAEIGDEFGVPMQKLVRFEQKWQQQRALGIMNESPPGPDRITVDDVSYPSTPWNWP